MTFEETTLLDQLLEAPCWVIDLLPRRVPADAGGQYFSVEAHYLSQPHVTLLRERQADLLIRLNCYYDLQISRGPQDDWTTNPDPDDLLAWVRECVPDNEMGAGRLDVLLPSAQSLVTLNREDTYLTAYNVPDELLGLLRDLAAAEGLFVWEGVQD